MTCPVSTMESPPPDDPDGFCRPDSLHAIQGEIEDIEIAQPSRRREAPVFFVDRMRDDEGHDLLAQSAVGSKAMTMKAADVMLGAAGADHGMSLADRNEISLAIARIAAAASITAASSSSLRKYTLTNDPSAP